MKKQLFAAAFLATCWAGSVTAQTAEALKVEVQQVDAQVTALQEEIAEYDGGLIQALAEMRLEALLMTRTLLQNRVLTAEGGQPVEVVVPATAVDEALANQILGEMAGAHQRVKDAEAEAQGAGGLIQALALGRVETEKLTLAQLQMAYFQAKYGIAFPKVPSVGIAATSPNASADSGDAVEAAGLSVQWADNRFPEVDYTLPVFEAAHKEGDAISGWWTISTERAAVDDSPQVTGVNYSAYNPRDFGGITALVARCIEGETAVLFLQDDYLMADFRSSGFDVTIRVDEAAAIETRWGSLTGSQGAGLFGAAAENFIRSVYDADKVFIRLQESSGQNHDALFNLAGAHDVYESVANACGWTTLELTSDDYASIQAMLNAGGFNAGTPDGQWGAGSKAAMKAYQSSVGLEPTGAPDRNTLAKLGL